MNSYAVLCPTLHLSQCDLMTDAPANLHLRQRLPIASQHDRSSRLVNPTADTRRLLRNRNGVIKRGETAQQ